MLHWLLCCLVYILFLITDTELEDAALLSFRFVPSDTPRDPAEPPSLLLPLRSPCPAVSAPGCRFNSFSL